MSTPLQSPRTIFILDVSGSMAGLKSETLHLSTKRYIEDISQNSYVGIVLFNNKAWIEHKVVKITDRKVRDSLSEKVPKMSRGNTDIGSGLLMALSSLTSQGISTEGANFILVTDGEDTTGTDYVGRVLPTLLDAKVKVICIALGNTADPNLERLAKETNGNVYIASDSNREMAIRVIESAFIEAKANKELNEALTISVCNDLIPIDGLADKKVIIDSDIGRNTNFTIGSEDIDKFSVSITSPGGREYDTDSSEINKNLSYKRYQLNLRNAESGVWSISFVKHSNQRISATVSVTSQPLNPNAIQMRAWLKDADINSQTPPLIFAEVIKGNDVILGAEVIATIDKPNGTQTEIKLNNYNNVYCNYFNDFCGPGRYNVSVWARNGQNKCQLKKGDDPKSTSATYGVFQNYFNWLPNPIHTIVTALGFQSVPQFERQRIVGCFKVTDSMPSTTLSTEKLEELLLAESFKLLSTSSNRPNNSVEAPAPRNAKTPIARVRTSLVKKDDQQLNEIRIAKDKLKELLLVVKKLITFSKLSEDEKIPFKKIVEQVDSFIFSTKSATMDEVDSNRLKLEELREKFSKK